VNGQSREQGAGRADCCHCESLCFRLLLSDFLISDFQFFSVCGFPPVSSISRFSKKGLPAGGFNVEIASAGFGLIRTNVMQRAMVLRQMIRLQPAADGVCAPRGGQDGSSPFSFNVIGLPEIFRDQQPARAGQRKLEYYPPSAGASGRRP
jgi:hypothetical protein